MISKEGMDFLYNNGKSLIPSRWTCLQCRNINDDGRGFIWSGTTPIECTKCKCKCIKKSPFLGEPDE